MPNGIKPPDPLDSLSPVVGSAYRSGGQPGTCKYWILDLGTHILAPAPASLLSRACFLPGGRRVLVVGLETDMSCAFTAETYCLLTIL